jgi:hypothetical protein
MFGAYNSEFAVPRALQLGLEGTSCISLPCTEPQDMCSLLAGGYPAMVELDCLWTGLGWYDSGGGNGTGGVL